MARKRNGRVVLAAELRSVKKLIATMLNFWEVSGKVYVEPQDRDAQSQWWRKRRPEEYPEAKFQNWALMARNAEAMASR